MCRNVLSEAEGRWGRAQGATGHVLVTEMKGRQPPHESRLWQGESSETRLELYQTSGHVQKCSLQQGSERESYKDGQNQSMLSLTQHLFHSQELENHRGWL